MAKLIKRGGFREQTARQLKYKNSVNQRTNISAQKVYQPSQQIDEAGQNNIVEEKLEQSVPTSAENLDKVPGNSSSENDSTNKNT